MQQIQLLAWDSDFFGYKVGKLNLSSTDFLKNESIENHDYELIYIFSENAIEDKTLLKIGAKLQDIKIELVRAIQDNLEINNNQNNLELKPIKVFSNNLFDLVLESGVYSRFKQDRRFIKNEFERLYKAWIEKALKDDEAQVIGAFVNNELLGFVSLTLKNGIADIGLIAVHEKARGKHIGKRLLEAAYNYACQNLSKTITVVTQETNTPAMQFYLNNGFKIYKRNFIYHLWKNSVQNL
jgi:dTDP-4-amino-4,6-dideoxy-D-galactose acyltransferase